MYTRGSVAYLLWDLRQIFIYMHHEITKNIKSVYLFAQILRNSFEFKNSCTQGFQMWKNGREKMHFSVSLLFPSTSESQYNAIHVHFPDEGVEDEKEQRDGICFRFVFIVKFKISFIFFGGAECEERKKRTSLLLRVCCVIFNNIFNDIFLC